MAKDIFDEELLKELDLEDVDFSDVDSILAELNLDEDGETDEFSYENLKADLGDENNQDISPEPPAVKEKEPAVRKTPAKATEKNKKKKPADRKPSAKSQTETQKRPEKQPTVAGTIVSTFIKTVAVVLCAALTVGLLGGVFLMVGTGSGSSSGSSSNVTILDKFDMYMTNEISNALEGVLAVEKVYWLSDSDLVAPEPKAENYGSVSTPAELMWLLEEAADLIGGQEMIFNADTPAWSGEPIRYYYDETILVITWKQLIDRVMYTMSEVKIAHASQFRRFLAGGEFGSDKQYVTTDMAASVNAVVASSGDFYKYRRNGAVVYEGQLRRFEGKHVDTCFINDKGDLLFAYRGDLTSEEQALQFVEENGVRFSLAFGPVLVDNGVACPPPSYSLGEINDIYARAALCQKGELHYLLVSACGEDGYQNRHNIADFAANVESFGVDKAYALDGGQTTVIAMDGQMINDVEFGYQRAISDIIYFATAMPDGG